VPLRRAQQRAVRAAGAAAVTPQPTHRLTIMVNAEQLIRCEIYKTLERVGAPPEVLAASINGASKEAMYEAAERLGADRNLLGFIA
jgi:hypothetical protein